MEIFGLLLGTVLGLAVPNLVDNYRSDPVAPAVPRWPAAVACAALSGLLAWRLGRPARALPVLVSVPSLLAFAWIDITTLRIPRRLVFHTVALCAAAACVSALIEPALADRIVAGGIAALATGAAVALLWWLSPRGLGYGDVRLQFLLGGLCGWVSRLAAMRCLVWAFLFGGIAAIALLATHRRRRSDSIAFGPFLIAGALLAIMWPR